MANLNVDFEAVEGDERYDLLARLGGYVDRDHARGKLEHVWLACTKRGTDTLAIWAIDTKMGRGAAAALVACGLGEFQGEFQGELYDYKTGEYGVTETDKIRLKGFKKRGDWLVKSESKQGVKSKAKGGRARAANAPRIGGRFVKSNPPASTSTNNLLVDAGTSRPPAEAQHSPAKNQLPPAPPALLTSDLTSNSQSIGATEPKKNKAAAALGSPLAPAWEPQQQQQQRCADLDLDTRGEIAKFKAHAESTGRVFTDPDNAFAIWIERSAERRDKPRARPAQPKAAPPRKVNVL